MRPAAATRIRRATFLVALLGATVGIVEARAATAPAARPVTLTAIVQQPPGLATPTPTPPGSSTVRVGSAPPRSGSSTPARAPATKRSVLGSPVDIGYGIVQVRLVLRASRITDVVAIRLPSDGRSADIASFAVPLLRSEVLARQSAQIDTVSGASYTSDGYARSVQSALDQAGIR